MIRVLLAVCVLAATGAAQTIYLTGIVRDSSDRPIAGATVRLVNRNLTTTSDATGRYTISPGAARQTRMVSPRGNAWRVAGHRLTFEVATGADVRVRLYDTRARVVATLIDRHLNAGAHHVDIRSSPHAHQALFARIECDGQSSTVQLPEPVPGRLRVPTSDVLAAQAATGAVATLDTLRATIGPSAIKLFVYSYVDTMDFWLGELSPLSEARQQCVHRINYHRSTVGLAPLARRRDKEPCVDGQARSDAASGVAHGAYGQCGERAQDECPSWNSLLRIYTGCLQMMWDEGPPPVGVPCGPTTQCYKDHGHYINMTGAYSGVACGYHTVSSTVHWGVQDFW